MAPLGQMNVTQVVTQRRDGLLRRWAANPSQMVQVENPAALGRLAYIDVEQSAQIGTMGRRSLDNVAMVYASDGMAPALWVRANYHSYRAAYEAFLKEHYGIANPKQGLQRYDIDHLLNRARSPSGNTFIRIEAIESHVNQEWGRTIEKIASNPKFWANQNRERRTLSWFIAAKLAGAMPPSGPNDQAGIQRIATRLAPYGLQPHETITGLTDMLRFAFGVSS